MCKNVNIYAQLFKYCAKKLSNNYMYSENRLLTKEFHSESFFSFADKREL